MVSRENTRGHSPPPLPTVRGENGRSFARSRAERSVPRRMSFPGPMDEHPKHHSSRPPIRRGISRPRSYGPKQPPLVRIPKPRHRRNLLEVAARIAREDARQTALAKREDYFHPPWYRPVGVPPCSSRRSAIPLGKRVAFCR